MPDLLFANEEKEQRDKKYNTVIKERVSLLKQEKKLETERNHRLCHSAKATRAALRRQQKIKQALALRLRNFTVDQIAVKLKVTPHCVYKWLQECFAELPQENIDMTKKMLNRNLELLLKRFHDDALASGDAKMADVALKSIGQIAKITGLNIQRREVETTNLGDVSPGVELAELNLDLETKKRLLQAIREKRKEKKDDAKNDDQPDDTEEEFEDDGDQPDGLDHPDDQPNNEAAGD